MQDFVSSVGRRRWTLGGRVQGVGFRPYVYRLASARRLTGFVRNAATQVIIEAQGDSEALASFEQALFDELPRLAWIDHQLVETRPIRHNEDRFDINASAQDAHDSLHVHGAPLGITPDASVCPDCVREMFNPADRRYQHGLISCSHCGPRYSIIDSAPYDRCNTTMASFAMCPDCAREYSDPNDRRFHAQPIACHACGPRMSLVTSSGHPIYGDPIEQAVIRLNAGAIVAIKGLGGFHLAVRADEERAVARLRRMKRRDARPFALMVASFETAEQLTELSSAGSELLRSPANPIGLAPARFRDSETQPASCPEVCQSVAPNNHRLGIMLPATPMQHLLFACQNPRLNARALVMTSGNISSEPLAIENTEALERLGDVCDAILWHDRPIRRPVDDSVFIDMGERIAPLPVRRARGYAPSLVRLPLSVDCPGLCVGGELKNTIAIVRGAEVYLSAHNGDLKHTLAYEHFRQCIRDMGQLFDVEPEWIAHDLHPAYLSTQYARQLAAECDIPLIAVQHHHAHAAALLAEHGMTEPAIAIVCDGVGYGSDGQPWGGEILHTDLQGFRRVQHLAPIALFGADSAAKHPMRCAMSLLHQALGRDFEAHPIMDTFDLSPAERAMAIPVLARRVNCVMSSAAGRVFDGVAALLGICRENRFEAEAPIALEAAAHGVEVASAKALLETCAGEPINCSSLVLHLAQQVLAGQSVGALAAFFHDQFADGLAHAARLAMENYQTRIVALSGGVFCNQRLTQRLTDRLSSFGATVLTHRVVPANDGGIAFGQAAVATARLRDAAH